MSLFIKNNPDNNESEATMGKQTSHSISAGDKTIRRNARGLLRLTILTVAFTVLGGLLSGCHPCSIPGVCEATWTEAVAYVGDKGEIYFDIPVRKNKRFELSSFGVNRINDEGFAAPPLWGIERLDYTPEGKLAVTDYIPLPLRYGQNIAGTRVLTPPKALNNGLYAIDGSIFVHGKGHFELMGRFSYDNGTVQNLND
jgi:hypothetical protein